MFSKQNLTHASLNIKRGHLLQQVRKKKVDTYLISLHLRRESLPNIIGVVKSKGMKLMTYLILTRGDEKCVYSPSQYP
jgi:hypothetical protein